MIGYVKRAARGVSRRLGGEHESGGEGLAEGPLGLFAGVHGGGVEEAFAEVRAAGEASEPPGDAVDDGLGQVPGAVAGAAGEPDESLWYGGSLVKTAPRPPSSKR